MSAALELTAKEDVTEKLFKLEQQNLRLIEQNKRLAQESRRAHKESKDGIAQVNGFLQAQVGDLKNVALGLVGGGGVVGAVTAAINAYSQWQEELKGLGKEHHEFSERLVADLMRSRDAMQAPEIEAWGRAQAGRGATEEQAQRLLAGVTSEMQAEPLARRKALAEGLMPALPILPGQGEQAEVAKIAGQFGGMFPEKSPREIAGLAIGLRQMPEVSAETLTGDSLQRVVSTWQKAGLSGEEAVARLLVGVEKGQRRPGALMAAAEAVDKRMDEIKPTRGRRLTPEEQAKNRFAQAEPAERIKMLDTDREVRDAVLGDQGLLFAQIGGDEVAAKLRQMKQMQAPGFISGQTERIGQSAAGAKVIAAHNAQIELEKLKRPNMELGGYAERYDAATTEILKSAPNWWDRLGDRMAHQLRWMFYDRPDIEAVRLLRQRQSLQQYINPEDAQRAGAQAEFWEKFARDEDAIREAHAQTELLREQNRRLEEIGKNTRPRPSAAAVQQNVRQHGEN